MRRGRISDALVRLVAEAIVCTSIKEFSDAAIVFSRIAANRAKQKDGRNIRRLLRDSLVAMGFGVTNAESLIDFPNQDPSSTSFHYLSDGSALRRLAKSRVYGLLHGRKPCMEFAGQTIRVISVFTEGLGRSLRQVQRISKIRVQEITYDKDGAPEGPAEISRFAESARGRSVCLSRQEADSLLRQLPADCDTGAVNERVLVPFEQDKEDEEINLLIRQALDSKLRGLPTDEKQNGDPT